MDTKFKPIHGLSDHRVYRIWRGMISRCYNKNDKNYVRYGARGISVCLNWQGEKGLINFYNWSLSNGYSKNLSIDRKNNNGNYEPLNCCWATTKQQANNRRTNKIIEFEGKSQTLQQWSDEYNLSPSLVSYRLNQNLPFDKCVNNPVKILKERNYTYNGESHNISEWARIIGIQKGTLYKRLLRQHWNIEQALTTPVNRKN